MFGTSFLTPGFIKLIFFDLLGHETLMDVKLLIWLMALDGQSIACEILSAFCNPIATIFLHRFVGQFGPPTIGLTVKSLGS